MGQSTEKIALSLSHYRRTKDRTLFVPRVPRGGARMMEKWEGCMSNCACASVWRGGRGLALIIHMMNERGSFSRKQKR